VRYSILLPFGPTAPEQTVPFANLVKWTGAERLWLGQGMVLESHHLVSWLAGIGIRVPAGFGVSLMPFRSPYQAAIEARSVAITTGHPVVAGFGPGSRSVQEGTLRAPYRSPLQASREFVQIVRGLLSGEMVERSGDYYSAEATLIKALSPPVRIGLGVLRPGMAALAGEEADVAITWLSSARHLQEVLMPAIRGAHRALPAPATVTAIVPVALTGPDRDVGDLVRAACGGHVQLPHYQDALRGAGIAVSGPDDVHRLVDGGVFLHGTVADVLDGLEAYRAAGVDEVVLNATGVAQVHGPKAAAKDLLAILREAPAPPGSVEAK
jgi:alkanesulfonate monooxygenase SsuD/methylene tetrahydromethanopterin reductase-like flavin-dependent oxidoreductase (luciferase family)